MSLYSLIKKLYPIYVGLAAIMILGTLLTILFPEMRFIGILNLRRERTIATWYEATLFLYLALIYVELWSCQKLDKKTRIFSAFLVFVFVFLSADEGARIHEQIGEKSGREHFFSSFPIFQAPLFSWILYYTPPLILGCYLIYRIYGKYLPSKKLLFLAFIFAFGIIILEGAEGFLVGQKMESQSVDELFNPSLPSGLVFASLEFVEETFELLSLLCLATFNLRILRQHSLEAQKS